MSENPMKAGERMVVGPDEGASISLGGLGSSTSSLGKILVNCSRSSSTPCSRVLLGLLRIHT